MENDKWHYGHLIREIMFSQMGIGGRDFPNPYKRPAVGDIVQNGSNPFVPPGAGIGFYMKKGEGPLGVDYIMNFDGEVQKWENERFTVLVSADRVSKCRWEHPDEWEEFLADPGGFDFGNWKSSYEEEE